MLHLVDLLESDVQVNCHSRQEPISRSIWLIKGYHVFWCHNCVAHVCNANNTCKQEKTR